MVGEAVVTSKATPKTDNLMLVGLLLWYSLEESPVLPPLPPFQFGDNVAIYYLPPYCAPHVGLYGPPLYSNSAVPSLPFQYRRVCPPHPHQSPHQALGRLVATVPMSLTVQGD